MADIPPPLPTRFPCWCRAVYSWGGESKKDLGFIEGDLIECLNAGDGSWWMGRLHRDRRNCGLFPSNFVKVLDDDFKPLTKTSSTLPSREPSPSPAKTKSVFRKPFQAYSATIPGSKSAQTSPMPTRQSSLQQEPQTPSRQGRHSQKPHETPSRHSTYLQQSQIPSRQSSLRSNNAQQPSRQDNYMLPLQQSLSRNNSGSEYRSRSPVPPMHSPSRQNSGREYRPQLRRCTLLCDKIMGHSTGHTLHRL